MVDDVLVLGTGLNLSGIKKDLKELERELARTEKEWQRLEDKKESSTKADEKIISKDPELQTREAQEAWERQVRAIQGIEREQAKVLDQQERYKQNLDALRQKYADMQALSHASDQLDRAVADDKFVHGITTQKEYNSLLAQTKAEMAMIEKHAARISAETGKPVDDILRVNAAYQKASNTARILESHSKDINRNIKQAEKNLRKTRNEADKLTKSARNGVMGFGKMQLVMMGMMFAMRAISSATREYMAVNTELEGQMNVLKAMWGQVLGPAIQWVINLLVQAVTAVNSFVYALTGINYVAKANEAALKKQASATSSAAKAAQLAGFDEQTKLADNSSSAADKNPVTLLDDTISALSGLAEKLKEQILAGDWYGAGKTAGEFLMNGINSIDWESVGATVGDIVGGAFAFALGFVVSLDPLTLLESGVKLITGLYNSLAQAVQGIDWAEVGKKIVDLLIGSMIMSFVSSNPLLLLLAIMLAPGGDEMAKAAAEWVGSLIGALAAAAVGMVERLGEISKFLFDTIKTWLDENVDWSGTPEEIIGQLFAGLLVALKGIGQWIYNNMWLPFRDGFQKAFGVHSPSTKMKEFGVNIIDGLKNGIVGGISKIKNACKEIWSAIKSAFSSVGTWFKNTFSDAWQKVKDVFSKGGKIFSGIKDGIASAFKTIVNTLISGINTVIATPFRSINNMLNTIRSTKVLGVQPFKSLWDYNPLSIPQIPKLALGGIVNRPGRGVPAIIGEAGAEAVLPLENNTEWMDMLAEKIGGNVTIPIYLDGRKMYTYFVDIGKRKAFAANGG